MKSESIFAEQYLAILNLEGEYARTWDTADAEGWASLFTHDGVFEMAAAGKITATSFKGRDELSAFCRSINESYQGLHFIHSPSLTIEDSNAKGWINFEFRAQHQGIPTMVCGFYEVKYIKTSDGWKIDFRNETVVQRDNEFYGIPKAYKEITIK